MTSLDDLTLHLHLAGILDPDQALEVKERLQALPEARTRLARLVAATELEHPVSPWQIPPPGLGWPSRASAADVMSGEGIRVGERFCLTLAPIEAPDDVDVVILRREDGQWQVLAPRSAEERFPLSAFARDADGRHRIDLMARPPTGRQRWAVALMPRATEVDWKAPEDTRWQTIQRGIAEGAITVSSIDVTVSD